MELYKVRKFIQKKCVTLDVPASKSILNRAIVLAAFGKGDVTISCGSFAEDTRAMLGCLTALGIRWERCERGLHICGCGGNIPNRRATLDVRSAGTAARFLTAALAFLGGEYEMRASEQMARRPMEILSVLEEAGVHIEPLGEKGHFPFRLRSDGIHSEELVINTDVSTQFASGVLLAAAVSRSLRVRLTGSRTKGSYLLMTLRLLDAFGASYSREGDVIRVIPSAHSPALFEAEGDLSGACYFYTLALLLGAQVRVRRIHADSVQGDKKFLSLLATRGVLFSDSEEGLLADGRNVTSFRGFEEDMRDYSDQALTVAALAPFADSPTRLTGLKHIRRQECDRLHAIAHNLSTLGVPVREEEDGVVITPAPVRGGTVETFGDHRVAMAFSLIGLKTGNIAIENPSCCKKTFDNYFQLLDELTS